KNSSGGMTHRDEWGRRVSWKFQQQLDEKGLRERIEQEGFKPLNVNLKYSHPGSFMMKVSLPPGTKERELRSALSKVSPQKLKLFDNGPLKSATAHLHFRTQEELNEACSAFSRSELGTKEFA